MKRWFVSLAVLVTASPSLADSISAEPNDHGKVTHIQKGVKELDLGGIFVLSHSQSGDAEGTTRISGLGGPGFQLFIRDNLSAGGTLLVGYERDGTGANTKSVGGLAFGSLHVRLGLGAFLRPTLGAGLLVGNHEVPVGPGMVATASQVAGLVRLALPFAYFPSRRLVLQAGPELDLELGSVTPDGGMAESFVTITGGFGISAGYAF